MFVGKQGRMGAAALIRVHRRKFAIQANACANQGHVRQGLVAGQIPVGIITGVPLVHQVTSAILRRAMLIMEHALRVPRQGYVQ